MHLQKVKFPKKIINLVIFILIITSIHLSAQINNKNDLKWINFTQSKTKNIRYDDKMINFKEFLFSAHTPGITLAPKKEKNQLYYNPILDGGHMGGIPGDPGIPGFTRMIMIPKNASLKIQVTPLSKKIINDLLIYPLQIPPAENEKALPFLINKKVYEKNAWLPESLFSVTYDSVRGCKVAILTVRTAQYNPKARQMIYYPDIEVSLNIQESGIVMTLFYKDKIIGQGISNEGMAEIASDLYLKEDMDLYISLTKSGYLTRLFPVILKD